MEVECGGVGEEMRRLAERRSDEWERPRGSAALSHRPRDSDTRRVKFATDSSLLARSKRSNDNQLIRSTIY